MRPHPTISAIRSNNRDPSNVEAQFNRYRHMLGDGRPANPEATPCASLLTRPPEPAARGIWTTKVWCSRSGMPGRVSIHMTPKDQAPSPGPILSSPPMLGRTPDHTPHLIGAGSLSIKDLKASRATQGETIDDSVADGSQDGDSQEALPQSKKGGMASALTAIEVTQKGPS